MGTVLCRKSELRIAVAQDGSEVIDRRSDDIFQVVDSRFIDEAVKAINSSLLPDGDDNRILTYIHDFGEQVGLSSLVETVLGDAAFYAPRIDSSGFPMLDAKTGKVKLTRWVYGVAKKTAREITFGLMRISQTRLALTSAYFGPKAMLEPSDPRATEEDLLWWFDPVSRKGHAYVSPFDTRCQEYDDLVPF